MENFTKYFPAFLIFNEDRTVLTADLHEDYVHTQVHKRSSLFCAWAVSFKLWILRACGK